MTAPLPPECDPERVDAVAQAMVLEAARSGSWDAHRLAAAAIAALPPSPSPAEGALRDALRAHHPIMRSETGPFSGCRCGQVRLGQDVIAHVVGHLRAALPPSPAEEAVKRVEAELDRQARLGHVNQYGATQLRAALASPAPGCTCDRVDQPATYHFQGCPAVYPPLASPAPAPQGDSWPACDCRKVGNIAPHEPWCARLDGPR